MSLVIECKILFNVKCTKHTIWLANWNTPHSDHERNFEKNSKSLNLLTEKYLWINNNVEEFNQSARMWRFLHFLAWLSLLYLMQLKQRGLCSCYKSPMDSLPPFIVYLWSFVPGIRCVYSWSPCGRRLRGIGIKAAWNRRTSRSVHDKIRL